MSRRAVGAAIVLLLVLAPAGVALAATDGSPTELHLTAETDTVSGEPVSIQATLYDARGRGVPGALIQLVTMVEFAGAEREQLLDEARTDEAGTATLVFAPTEPGKARITARFAGAVGYGASEAELGFRVPEPVVVFHPEPLGIQVSWARSPLILLPFAAVWVAYAVAVGQALRLRRAGPIGVGSEGPGMPGADVGPQPAHPVGWAEERGG